MQTIPETWIDIQMLIATSVRRKQIIQGRVRTIVAPRTDTRRRITILADFRGASDYIEKDHYDTSRAQERKNATHIQ